MRIYNGKSSHVDLPLTGSTRVTIEPHSVSKEIMPSSEFLTMVAQNYDETELALIVAGPYEINMCAHNPASSPMVVESIDEAIARFSPVVKKSTCENKCTTECNLKEKEVQCPIMPEEVKVEETIYQPEPEKVEPEKVEPIKLQTKAHGKAKKSKK